MEKISIPKYTLGEEIMNSVTHGIGAGLAIAGLVLLIIFSHSPIAIVSSAVFGSVMIILFTISCIYHALSPNVAGKKVLRVIDHCNVILMVAGTYTPICLSLLGGALGWTMFGIVWGVTIVAIVFNAIDVDRFTFVTILCCLVVGWAGLFIIKPLINACGLGGLMWLLIGGLVYSTGAVLYCIGKRHRYIHSVFHLFVLGGSICHFFFILFYCI